jgi:hypothetical protein
MISFLCYYSLFVFKFYFILQQLLFFVDNLVDVLQTLQHTKDRVAELKNTKWRYVVTSQLLINLILKMLFLFQRFVKYMEPKFVIKQQEVLEELKNAQNKYGPQAGLILHSANSMYGDLRSAYRLGV